MNIVRPLCVLALAAGAGCSPEMEEAGVPAAQVTVSIVSDGYGLTRSSFTWGEDEIRDIQVVVTTEEGEVYAVLYSDTPSNLQFTGTVGRLYKLWAAANLGGKVEVRRLEDFTERVRQVTSASIAVSGIPMFSEGSCSVIVTGGGDHAVIPLSRMMARVDLRVDKGRLDYPGGFSVTGVRVCSPVNAFTPFAGEVARSHDGAADYICDNATSQDLSRLNGGGTVRLYTFENMQGTLLPGNTDPWRKVPSGIGEAGPYCTYLEVVCSYDTPDDQGSDITYRMYLGENATTNFDVRRNTVYSLTLQPTEREIRGGRGSWKIEPGSWESDVVLEFFIEPSSLELKIGESADVYSYYLVTYPDGRQEVESTTCQWETDPGTFEYLSFSAGSYINRHIYIPGISVTGISPGEAVVRASVDLGDDFYEASLYIEVLGSDVYSSEFEYDLQVDPDSVTISEGEAASFTATYITREFTTVNGVRTGDDPVVTETDVTSSAYWSVDSGSRYVSNEGAGVFRWTGGPGSAIIRARYDGMYDTAAIVTEEHVPMTEYRYEYSISPEESEIIVGETVEFTVTMLTYTIIDGVEQPGYESEDLPGSGLSWRSSRTTVATVSDGIATGLDSGTSVITARTGDGVSLSATLEVRHVFEFTDGPDEILPGESFNLSFTTTLDIGDIDIDCSDSGFSIGKVSYSHVIITCNSGVTPGSTVTVTGGNERKGATDSWSITVGTPPPPDPVVTYSLAVSVNGSDISPVGETISLSALLTVYHDGEYHETRDVTDDCVWGCEYTDVSVNAGIVSSSSNGFFDIVATYSIDGTDYQDSCEVTFTAREYINITVDYDSDMNQFWASASADCAVPLPVFVSATFYTWTGGYVGEMAFYIQQDDCDSQYNYAPVGAEGAPGRYVINFAEFSNGSSEFYDEDTALYWCLSY